MPIHWSILLFVPFLLFGCSGAEPVIIISDLDYAEIENHTGWHLRLHGDGSGSLRHDQLPAHHLHFPVGTFDLSPARSLSQRCRGNKSGPVCTALRYHAAMENKINECRCVSGSWTTEMMEKAIGSMQMAVDAGSSERSCRMLRRQWLAAR
ncbi:hypothetical protein [Neolewinella agarilytica]|uniref:hypothetical protein n=1 Tax=Neolewinella agarilytica TaxID=478744 RepID=UPI001113BBFE|nr:hypothetical protein [Neolewinella agarilytica]